MSLKFYCRTKNKVKRVTLTVLMYICVFFIFLAVHCSMFDRRGMCFVAVVVVWLLFDFFRRSEISSGSVSDRSDGTINL